MIKSIQLFWLLFGCSYGITSWKRLYLIWTKWPRSHLSHFSFFFTSLYMQLLNKHSPCVLPLNLVLSTLNPFMYLQLFNFYWCSILTFRRKWLNMNISLKYISNTSALSSVCKCSFSLWHFWLKQAAVFSEKAFKNPLCKHKQWLTGEHCEACSS